LPSRRPRIASRVRSETLRAPVTRQSRRSAEYSSSERRTLIIRDRGLRTVMLTFRGSRESSRQCHHSSLPTRSMARQRGMARLQKKWIGADSERFVSLKTFGTGFAPLSPRSLEPTIAAKTFAQKSNPVACYRTSFAIERFGFLTISLSPKVARNCGEYKKLVRLMQDISLFARWMHLVHFITVMLTPSKCVPQCKTHYFIRMTGRLRTVCSSRLQTRVFCIQFKSSIC